jgi:acetolactate synthase-1/2/3 large subunit
MMRYCTRYNSLVSHADQLETKLINALMRAFQSPQGPVHLSIPVDILRSAVATPSEEADHSAMVYAKPSMVDLDALRALKGELERAESPVFLIGDGCGEAVDAIMRLVDLTGAQFITTPDGKGLVNPRHHAFRGVVGFGGHASADALLRSHPDLVVAFGTAFSELASAGWSTGLMNSRLIHVDPSDEHLMRSPMARLHVRGQILAVCRQLIESLPANDAHNVVSLPSLGADAPNPHVSLHAPEQIDNDATPIKPQRLMRELSRRCPPNTRFLADTGNSMIWAVHYLSPRNRRAARAGGAAGPVRVGEPERRTGTANWLRVMMDFAPMGWAIGAAVGIARANPSCPVVCITGDGSYLMSGQEIGVAAAEGLTVVYVVLNDSAYGMVMHGQRLAKAEPIGFELPKVDFAAVAQAMGVPGHVVESPADFDALDFHSILTRRGPTLIDVRIDRDEVPPMIQRLKALGAVK